MLHNVNSVDIILYLHEAYGIIISCVDVIDCMTNQSTVTYETAKMKVVSSVLFTDGTFNFLLFCSL
jgi:hypothetical protein